MGTAGAIIGGSLISGVGTLIAGERAASAGQGAAEAQLAEERARREQALEFAELSPEEIQQIDQTIAVNDREIARKEDLLASTDPALIESGKQALQLLQGQEAATLDPLRQQRGKQREQLENRLRQQLGTGFATSTAGLQALNEFDQQTDATLAQEQSRSLGQLLGVAQNTRGLASLTPNVQTGATLANLLGTGKQRSIQALIGTPIQNAGAPFVGDSIRAGTVGSAIGQIGGGLSLANLVSTMNPTKQGASPGTVGGLFTGTVNPTIGNIA